MLAPIIIGIAGWTVITEKIIHMYYWQNNNNLRAVPKKYLTTMKKITFSY